MAKMRARRISGSRWVTRSGSRPSGIARASRSAMPSRRSAWASNMTPPSELIRPPSKAAVIFLRRTAGKQNGRRLSSVMAGVRASIPAKGWLQQPNPTPDQQLTLLPPPLIRPRHEYDRLEACQASPEPRIYSMADVPGSFFKRSDATLCQVPYGTRARWALGYVAVADSCHHVAVIAAVISLFGRCSAAVIPLLLSLFLAPIAKQNVNVFSWLDHTPADGKKFRIKPVTGKAQ